MAQWKGQGVSEICHDVLYKFTMHKLIDLFNDKTFHSLFSIFVGSGALEDMLSEDASLTSLISLYTELAEYYLIM